MSAATDAAYARRSGRSAAAALEVQWFVQDFHNRMDVSLRQRVQVAVVFLQDAIVKNISVPVVKKIVNGRTIVTKRSKPGEFPRADTTQLMKTIFNDVVDYGNGVIHGYVGTPLGYGLELETLKQRQFLTRTLNEEIGNITGLLTGPIV